MLQRSCACHVLSLHSSSPSCSSDLFWYWVDNIIFPGNLQAERDTESERPCVALKSKSALCLNPLAPCVHVCVCACKCVYLSLYPLETAEKQHTALMQFSVKNLNYALRPIITLRHSSCLIEQLCEMSFMGLQRKILTEWNACLCWAVSTILVTFLAPRASALMGSLFMLTLKCSLSKCEQGYTCLQHENINNVGPHTT